ncbi:hypothetical protein CDAR_446851 [Caerostris darwini]|uniref:Uncharacterized protein n=1 Tax=Caerostris darwini TaxID=1538125 RepID=A0AAV4MR65_9ARAC|nr:hypothetical protein CDAR_446851 [Caerostris darwini]
MPIIMAGDTNIEDLFRSDLPTGNHRCISLALLRVLRLKLHLANPECMRQRKNFPVYEFITLIPGIGSKAFGADLEPSCCKLKPETSLKLENQRISIKALYHMR